VPNIGVVVRGVDDTGVVPVDTVVGPDILRDDIGGGISTDGVGMGLGGGRGGGGDGERVDCTGGGSMSETGISETSPVLPSINGDRASGGNDGSITTLLRRGELVRSGEVLRSGDEAERRTLEGAEDILICDERSGDDGSVDRVSRSGIRLNVDVFRVCGGDFCVGSRGLEDELGPGPVLEDGPGCKNRSGESVSWWWDPFGRRAGNVLGLIGSDFRVVFCMPLVAGGGSSEDAVEVGESDGGVNPTIDADLCLPLVFTPSSGVSFEGVVDGENVFPLEPRLLTLDGRDGGLTMGARVADKFLECRFDFSQSVRRCLWPTLSDRPCTPDMAPAVVRSGSSPPSLSFRERAAVGVGIDQVWNPKAPSTSPPSEPKRCRRLASDRLLSSLVCL